MISYIREKYPAVVEGIYSSPHAQMPTFELGDGSVGLGSTKSYISLYFSNFDAPKIITATNPKIKAGKCCVNIRDGVSWPMEEIKRAIDFCLE